MTLTAATIGSRSVHPGILVQLGDYRYSSRETISWGGYTWISAGITKTGPSDIGSGRAEIGITLVDNETTWPAVILAGLAHDLPCVVLLYYINANGAAETEQIFGGVIRSIRAENDGNGQTITFSGITEGPDVTWSPRITWKSPFAVGRGGEVRINTETFILE